MRSNAFTLVEMVLALLLLLLLSGIVVVNVGWWQSAGMAEEGASRLENMLVMARAEAINRGRRLRLAFDDPAAVRVLWEPDPLTEPGYFEEFAGAQWQANWSEDFGTVVRCQLVGESAYRIMPDDAASDSRGALIEPITFHFNGSCDSAVIELAPPAGDERRVVIEVDGPTATVQRRILSPQSLADYYAQEGLAVD